MDVTRENFQRALRLFHRLLPDAAFVALDFEFTGLGVSRPSNLDTPQQRYDCARRDARTFPPIQMGIAIFHKRLNPPHCFAIPFNFNIYPHAVYYPRNQRYPLIETIAHFQGSSVRFLADNQFNFDRLMTDTVSWLRPVDEVYLREVVTQHVSARRNPKVSVKPDQHTEEFREALASIRKSINTWVEKDAQNSSFDLNPKVTTFPAPPHPLLRRLVFDMLRDSYPRTSADIISTQAGSRLRVVLHPTEELAKQQRQEDINNEIDFIVNTEIGVRSVIDALRAQRVPIVVHNGLLDMTKLYANFVDDLPSSLSEFKQTFEKEFPVIYDTRLLFEYVAANLPEVARCLPFDMHAPYELSDYLSILRGVAYEHKIDQLRSIDTFVSTRHLRIQDPAASNAFADDAGYFFVPEDEEEWNYDADADGFGRYSSPDDMEFRHEAGFDALQTGKLFALVEGLLKSEGGLSRLANKVHLARCGGYRYIDLEKINADRNEWFERNAVIVQGGNPDSDRRPGEEHWCRKAMRKLTDGTVFNAEKSNFEVVSRTAFLALLLKEKADDLNLDLSAIETVIANGHKNGLNVTRYELKALEHLEASGENAKFKRRRVM